MRCDVLLISVLDVSAPVGDAPPIAQQRIPPSKPENTLFIEYVEFPWKDPLPEVKQCPTALSLHSICN